MVRHPALDPTKLGLREFTDAWIEQRRPFSRGVEPVELHTVSGAFAGLVTLCKAVEQRPEAAHRLDRLELLEIADRLQDAEKVAWRASGMSMAEWDPVSTEIPTAWQHVLSPPDE